MYHHEASALVHAAATTLFDHVDDHTRLSSHMKQSSWRTGGGRMTVDVDEGGGKTIGSHIRIAGRVFGIPLFLEEVVTERDPPRRKVWETTGEPRLLVMGSYRMGFDIEPRDSHTLLRVFIDYTLPRSLFGSGLGRLFARYYAHWCTERIVGDAAAAFS